MHVRLVTFSQLKKALPDEEMVPAGFTDVFYKVNYANFIYPPKTLTVTLVVGRTLSVVTELRDMFGAVPLGL
jgi:hypothetical protein